MNLGVIISNGFQKLSILAIDQDARLALGAYVQVPNLIARNSAMGSPESLICRQCSPIRNYVVRPFAIAGTKLSVSGVLLIGGSDRRGGRAREHAQCGNSGRSAKPAPIDGN